MLKKKSLSKLILGFSLSLALALLSYAYQRQGPEFGVFGNVCGPEQDQLCLRPLLNAGFPWGYVFDNSAISVHNQLTPVIEDEVRLVPFFMDVGFYGFCILVLSISAKRFIGMTAAWNGS